jgi:hypothetical protein
VTIVGAGADRTRIVGNSGSYALGIFNADSKVKNLRIHIAMTGASYTGIKLQGSATGIEVTAADDSAATAISMEGGAGSVAELRSSVVKMPTAGSSVGVLSAGQGDRLIKGSRIKARTAVRVNTVAPGAADTTSVERCRLKAPVGVEQSQGDTEVDDTLIEVKPVPAAQSEAGLIAFGHDGDSALFVNHVTEVGARPLDESDVGTRGVVLAITGDDPTAIVRNSILFRNHFDVQNNDGTASLEYSRVGTFSGDPVTVTNSTDARPRLRSGSGFRLRPSSPLIDFGDPAGLLPGEPRVDLDGNDRIVNGDGHGGARRDAGAYELQR